MYNTQIFQAILMNETHRIRKNNTRNGGAFI